MEINPQNQQIHLLGLNDQQRDAVLCRNDIVYVSAGPGTGKTHMLTSKLVDFIVSSEEPQKIVALSYTNTAARQLGDRFEKKIRECGVTADYSFFNGTIHSFCYRMMKQFGESAFDYVILDDEELTELAQEIGQYYDGKYPLQTIMSRLRTPKADDPLSSEISELKEAYKVISIQDILSRFIRMMDTDPAFRLFMRDQVTVMAIDEAQDLSDFNYSILDRLISAVPR
ncbi:MAG: UvrD-helicase domain-containing protein, partial [Candidatus Methanomethylophilaceae archaeon]|nr:UvrD-helicase domain-containing protein [Candidatus Methanomethylophilaceae archaeon]